MSRNNPYDASVKACQSFFARQLLRKKFYVDTQMNEDEKRELEKFLAAFFYEGDQVDEDEEEGLEEFLTKEFYTKEFYDITGLSAIQVIAVLTDIVNDPEKWSDSKVFYFVIKTENKSAADERLFKLMAKPTELHPGNGFVVIWGYDSQSKSWLKLGRKYIYLLARGDLKLGSKTFAEVIQRLFKDNSDIVANDLIIAEVYFLLLFEIARRLSDKEDKTDEAKQLDELPVGIAIARQIRKMAAESEDTSMELKTKLKSLFDCFRGSCEKRKVAIRKVIGNAVSEILTEMFCGPDEVPSWLITRLEDMSMQAHNVRKDGNCFFRAVSHQHHGNVQQHNEIRRAGIEYLQSHPDEFPEVTENGKSREEYIKRMSQDGEWCDNLIMRAVARALDVDIHVIRENEAEDNHLVEDAENTITVGYINCNHYVSVDELL